MRHLLPPLVLSILFLTGLRAQQWQWGAYVESGYSSVIIEPRPTLPSNTGPLYTTESGRIYWQLGITGRTQLFGGLHWRPQMNITHQRNEITVAWADLTNRTADLSGLSVGLTSLFEIQYSRLPAAPFVLIGPQVHYYFSGEQQVQAPYLTLDQWSLSAVLGLGFDLPLGQLRLRPAVQFDLGLTSRLRGASERRFLEAFSGLRQDLLGVQIGVFW